MEWEKIRQHLRKPCGFSPIPLWQKLLNVAGDLEGIRQHLFDIRCADEEDLPEIEFAHDRIAERLTHIIRGLREWAEELRRR